MSDDAARKAARDETGALLAALARKWDVVPTDVADAITQALVTVLGSGPSLAWIEGTIANNPDGILNHDAVRQQQIANILQMVMTAKIVRDMLDDSAPTKTPDVP